MPDWFAFGLVTLLRYPLSMGLMITGGRAQIGEFSFILAGLGVTLGLLPKEGQDLVLAGALLSITLNPLMILATTELQKWFRAKWPTVVAGYGRKNHDRLVADLARIRAIQEARDEARHVKIQELLTTFPLLSLVPPDDQEELLLLFRPASASPVERVIRTGDRADGMYFISSGAVEVRVGGRSIRLDAGSFFGEMALLSGSRRTADVIAIDFCDFQFLERRDFTQFMARHPELRAAVDKMAHERIEANRAHASGAPDEENSAHSAR